MITSRRLMLGLTLALAVTLGPQAGRAADIPVRLGVITSGGQSDVPYAIKKFELDKKYGFDLQQIELSAPGQQYVMLRADALDISPGTFVDLMRQRKAGIGLKAFHGRQHYNNRIVTKPDSPIKSFADLKGRKFGNFGNTFLDWLIIRAAGKKAYGLDLEKDATIVSGAPPLLNQFLVKGEAEAVLQFSTLTIGPITRGEQRVIVDVPGIMTAAGFDSDVFNSHWLIGDKWLQAHSDALGKLDAMFDEAYAILRRDDSMWTTLGERIGMTNPADVVAYYEASKATDNPPYSKDLIRPTQDMVDAIIAIAGEGPLGFSKIDPDAFVFPKGK